MRTKVTTMLMGAVVCAASVLGSTPGAGAAPPVRDAVDLPAGTTFIATDTLGGDPCEFPLRFTVLRSNLTQTTFTRDGVQTIRTAGALKVRLTNVETGESIDRNISGPVQLTTNRDGSKTQIGTGPQFIVLDPGIAPALPRAVLTRGRLVSSFAPDGTFTLDSLTGRYEDICASLAG